MQERRWKAAMRGIGRVVVAPALCAGGVALAQPAPVPAEPSGVLSLQASATAEVEHDVMSIVFGTSRDGPDAPSVQAELRQALDAALAQARRAVQPQQLEVETGQFSLYPRAATKNQAAGWRGSAELRVYGRDMAAIAQLSGRITTMSISRVGYELSRERREAVEKDLVGQAVQRFRDRAAEYARLFGYVGYTVREVSVNGSEPQSSAPMFRMRAMAASADESLPTEAGKGSVSVSVGGSVQMTR